LNGMQSRWAQIAWPGINHSRRTAADNRCGSMQKGVGNVLEISSPVAMWILISFRRLFKIQAFFVGQLKIRGDFWTRDHKLLMSLP